VRHLGESAAAVDAAFDLVQWRKTLLDESRAARRDALLAGRYPEHAAALRELADLRMKIGRKSLAGPGPEGGEAHGRMLDEWRARRRHLEAELTPRIPEMSLVSLVQTTDRATVAGRLTEGTTLVDYVRGRLLDFQADPRGQAAHFLAFVRPAEGGPMRLIDLGDAAPLDRALADDRASLVSILQGLA